MKYQKITNLSDNTPNQPTKFRTRYWVEINDVTRGTYNSNSQIKFKTSKLNQVYEILMMHIYLYLEI